uniref:hypothetical protein n=1 Tax=Xanthomonas axonopodis TaxID=53413 RepID=UPI0019D28968
SADIAKVRCFIGLHHHRCEALILASLELDQRCLRDRTQNLAMPDLDVQHRALFCAQVKIVLPD